MPKQMLELPSFLFRIRLKSLSVSRLLREQLLTSVSLGKQTEAIADFPEYREEDISLYRLKTEAEIIYRTQFPLQISQRYQLSSEMIYPQLLANLSSLSLPSSPSPCLEFEVRGIKPGWLEFQLSDRALAVWLQQLPEMIAISSSSGKNKVQEDSHNLFPLQYAHARCCSVLRLGHREGLIQLKSEALAQSVWQWQQPSPIPWFNSQPEPGQFCLVHPRERRLIHQLLVVVEAWELSDKQDWIKLATALSQALLNFYRSCRIWGEVKQENPDLARARLGLIALTQFMLRGLLQEHIGVSALVEL